MAISDYIPNIFGQQGSLYEGLLSPQESANLSQRSNIAGLLGTAATLAAGMGRQGPRRSATQNILAALGAGYGASGQAFQGGIEQMVNAQKLAQMKLQMQQNVATQQAINTVLQDPRFASDPTMRAALLADPAGFLKMYAQNAPVQAAISGVPVSSTQVPSAPVLIPQDVSAPVSTDTKTLPGMTLVATNRLSNLEQRRIKLIDINDRLSGVPGDNAAKQREINNKDLESIRKEMETLSVTGYDFNALTNTVQDQLKPFVAELKNLAETGGLSANQLAERVQAIQTASLELKKGHKYEGIVGNYAYTQFGTTDQSKLTPDQNKNVLAYANATTQADQTKIAIDAQKLKYETGIGVAVPTSRAEMLNGVSPTAITPSAPVTAPAVSPVVPTVPAQAVSAPVARVVPRQALQTAARETVAPAPVAPQPKARPIVDIGKVTPLIQQPDNKVTPKRKQELIAAQPATIGLVNYTVTQLVDARDAAQSLLNNPAELKAISGFTGPMMSKAPGTDAFTGAAKLENLQTRSFVTEIQRMRTASPTGGAVGSVTEKEMAALSNIQASLKSGLKEDVLRKQLKQYIDSANRALKTIPNEYARTYGYQGEFDDILKGGVVQQPEVILLPKGVTVKKVK